MDTGLRRYDAAYYKPPLVMLEYDTPRQGDFFYKEQIAKRKEHPSVHGTAEIKN